MQSNKKIVLKVCLCLITIIALYKDSLVSNEVIVNQALMIPADTDLIPGVEHAATYENFITITTENDDYPQGKYWKAAPIVSPDLGHKVINPSSVDIGKESYGGIIEAIEKKDIDPDDDSLFPGQYSHPDLQKILYLGFFVDQKSEQTIYLYGLQSEHDDDDGDDDEGDL